MTRAAKIVIALALLILGYQTYLYHRQNGLYESENVRLRALINQTNREIDRLDEILTGLQKRKLYAERNRRGN